MYLRNLYKQQQRLKAHKAQDRAATYQRHSIVYSDVDGVTFPHSAAAVARLKHLTDTKIMAGLTPVEKDAQERHDREQRRRLIEKARIVGETVSELEPLQTEVINERFLDRLKLATGEQLDKLKSWDDAAAVEAEMVGGGGPRKRSARKRKSRKRSTRKRKSRKRSARKRKSRKRSARKR